MTPAPDVVFDETLRVGVDYVHQRGWSAAIVRRRTATAVSRQHGSFLIVGADTQNRPGFDQALAGAVAAGRLRPYDPKESP